MQAGQASLPPRELPPQWNNSDRSGESWLTSNMELAGKRQCWPVPDAEAADCKVAGS